jgi:hypothetical protein
MSRGCEVVEMRLESCPNVGFIITLNVYQLLKRYFFIFIRFTSKEKTLKQNYKNDKNEESVM